MKKTDNYGEKFPEMFITKGKQRIKQHDKNVYLKNGDEFEIELFNPLSTKILAKISLNGKSIGSGIVIRPGERVFLERYIDTAKKFLFDTYTVDGKNQDVIKAIEKNGNVKVDFYSEYFKPEITWYSSNYYNQPVFGNYNPHEFYTTNSTTSNTWVQSNFTSNTNSNTNYLSKTIETGRVEQGSNSNQKIEYDNSTFESYSFYTKEWNILPYSRKEITKDDLVVYCTVCGRKRRNGENFCPKDGNKF